MDLKNSSLVQDLVNKSDVSNMLKAVLDGQSLSLNECIRLIRSEDVYAIGIIGNILRQRLYGNTVTFVNNIILNYTNVCITYCKFCAFYRKPGDKEAYTVPLEEILRRVVSSREIFWIIHLLLQVGHNPNLGIESY